MVVAVRVRVGVEGGALGNPAVEEGVLVVVTVNIPVGGRTVNVFVEVGEGGVIGSEEEVGVRV
jgi:hypothetical protein